jgi:hypothetical protein
VLSSSNGSLVLRARHPVLPVRSDRADITQWNGTWARLRCFTVSELDSIKLVRSGGSWSLDLRRYELFNGCPWTRLCSSGRPGQVQPYDDSDSATNSPLVLPSSPPFAPGEAIPRGVCWGNRARGARVKTAPLQRAVATLP